MYIHEKGLIIEDFSFKKAGGWGGIRTHGDSRLGGFQDRYHKPLGHPSTRQMLVPLSHVIITSGEGCVKNITLLQGLSVPCVSYHSGVEPEYKQSL